MPGSSLRWIKLFAAVFWIYNSVIFSAAEITNTRDICNRDPPDTSASKSPGDDGFTIKIAGRPMPERYTPDQVYTVSINGTYENQLLRGFMLVAVPLNAMDESTAMGTFEHMSSGSTQAASSCPHVITHTNLHPKAGVEVLWTAPPAGTGCVEFRATVIARNGNWYKNDGALTRVFCEDTAQTENHQPLELIPDCCACGVGKYQMTFKGQWSRRTHPRHYPDNKRLLHWSNIVGASHNKHYSIWQYGGYASEGVREVCEYASPNILEEELREHSADVRSVIKTPGVWYTEPIGLDQTRWARFSVDRNNHLLSMLTMIGPSPDWCVGVSALDLCLPNCTWAGDMVIDLYPWDAGTDDGISYMSNNARSNPPQKISRITNTSPNNHDSPFYGARPIRRMAQLEITRIHPRDNEVLQCDESDVEIPRRQGSPQEGECATTEWTDWSECSVTCGVGQRHRRRTYVNRRIQKAQCRLSLLEYENCIGVENECETVDNECELTLWSFWSPCSVTCGRGYRERKRVYLSQADHCNEETERTEPCWADIANCSEYRRDPQEDCTLDVDEGPCRALNERWFYNITSRRCEVFNYGGCRGNSNRFPSMRDCMSTCSGIRVNSDAPRNRPTEPNCSRRKKGKNRCTTPAARTSTTTSTTTTATTPTTTTTTTVGTTTTSGDRRSVDCRLSQWTQWTPCSSSCGRSYKERHRTVIRQARNGGVKCPKKLFRRRRCKVPKCVDCQMSEWGEWTPCAKTCGTGSIQERSREILSQARRRGTPCGSQLERRYCQLPACPSLLRNKREAELGRS